MTRDADRMSANGRDEAVGGAREGAGERRLDRLPTTGRGSVAICTLGGVADIGMNLTLYGCEGRYLLVDAGTTFAPREVVGVEAVMPDPRVLRELGDRLLGLVVTHAHEDHIGAIHRLWPSALKCPIHAGPFAAQVLNARFQDAGTRGRVDLRTFQPGASLRIGPFEVGTIPVAHSTPHCVALVIEAAGRRILHTGDWKIDPTPGLGGATDLERFAAVGRRGVDLMVGDSTNADREVPQTSEREVEVAMAAIFARAKGMVVVASFGSNVARMASVAHAAKRTQRKVALAGRSLRAAGDHAQALGLMAGVPRFLEDASRFRGTQRRGCVLMCTGTQGEETATLTKLAEGRRDPRRILPEIGPGDVVVHSARPIPGNETYIEAVLDKLRARGATVVTSDERFEGAPVHVTGHPCRADLRAMYAAVRPRLAMPVHGTPGHLRAHAELAEACGVAGTLEPEDGGVYELGERGLAPIGRLRQGRVAVLGDGVGTIVAWDVDAERPILSEGDRVRLEDFAARNERKAKERLARDERRLAATKPRPGRDGAVEARDRGEKDRGGKERGGKERGDKDRGGAPLVASRGAERADGGVRGSGRDARRGATLEGAARVLEAKNPGRKAPGVAGRIVDGKVLAGKDRSGRFVTQRVTEGRAKGVAGGKPAVAEVGRTASRPATRVVVEKPAPAAYGRPTKVGTSGPERAGGALDRDFIAMLNAGAMHADARGRGRSPRGDGPRHG